MTVLPSSAIATSAKISVDRPRPVTRVQSPEEGFTTSTDQKTIIDWLTVTFAKPNFTVQFLIGLIADYMGCNLRGVDKGKGFRGFTNSVAIEAEVNGKFQKVGHIAFGGANQKNRWIIDLEGSACGLMVDWETFQDLLENLPDCKITRCDLACDFHEGEKTVDDAVEMFKRGEFNMNGKPPENNETGDWLIGKRGRTFYVGKRIAGKQLCIYEKGKQLGDYESNWTRYELRLGNKNRVIPFDILTNPDKYFAGAYPALQAILQDVEGERIKTFTKEGHISMVQLTYHLRRCYGKYFATVKEASDYDISELIEAITVSGAPNRLDPACTKAKLSWPTIKSELRRVIAHG